MTPSLDHLCAMLTYEKDPRSRWLLQLAIQVKADDEAGRA